MRSITLGLVILLMMAGSAFCQNPQTYVDNQSYVSYMVVPQLHNVRTTTTVYKQVSVSNLPAQRSPEMVPYQQYAPPTAYPPVNPPRRMIPPQYPFQTPNQGPPINNRMRNPQEYNYQGQPCIFAELLMMPFNCLSAMFAPDYYGYNYYY